MNTDLHVNTESVVSVFIVYTYSSIDVVLLFSITMLNDVFTYTYMTIG